MSGAVVIAGVRTPVGRYGGALSGERPDDLAALVVAEAVKRSGVDPAEIEDVWLGCANQELLLRLQRIAIRRLTEELGVAEGTALTRLLERSPRSSRPRRRPTLTACVRRLRTARTRTSRRPIRWSASRCACARCSSAGTRGRPPCASPTSSTCARWRPTTRQRRSSPRSRSILRWRPATSPGPRTSTTTSSSCGRSTPPRVASGASSISSTPRTATSRRTWRSPRRRNRRGRHLLYVSVDARADTLVLSYSLRCYSKRPDPMADDHAIRRRAAFPTAEGTFDAISVGETAPSFDPVAKELADLWN